MISRFKYIYLFIFSFLITLGASGQTELSPRKLKELAEFSEIKGDTYSAIFYYELLQKQKAKITTQHKLAYLYTVVRDYENAKNTLLLTLKSSKNKSKVQLNLGISYKHLGQYDSCLYYLNKCTKKQLNNNQVNLLKKELKGAQLAIETPADTGTISIGNKSLSINTNHMESAPYFINDSLIIYATQNINSANLYSYNDTNTMPTTKLLYASKQADDWIKGQEIFEINSKILNAGNCAFSLQNNMFYFTNTVKNWDNKNISQIYVCEHHNSKFTNPVKLDSKINDPYYSSTHPTIGNTFNADFEILYFSSDRPGGKGGMDIWYSVYNKRKGTFGAPINAGKRVNTLGDEITPHYDVSTRTLYFSSNGFIGYGGYDVYKSVGELKSWTNPENIGNYLNSNADEIYFRLNVSRTAGFIVSNNPKQNSNVVNNYCCFDLQYFTYKNPDQMLLKGTLLAKTNPVIDKLLKSGIEFRDSLAIKNNYLKDAVVSLYLKTEMDTDSLYITSDTSDNNGFFKFNAGSDQDYTLIIEENNEVKAQVEVSTKGANNSNPREIILDIAPIEALPDMPLVIKNIYYDFGESDLSLNAKKILDETLIELLKE
nr:hypothetical protein [Salinivirgaceae bacterium]